MLPYCVAGVVGCIVAGIVGGIVKRTLRIKDTNELRIEHKALYFKHTSNSDW